MKRTSIKLKFKASVNPRKEGSLIFQLIHERKVRRIKSQFKIFKEEWDEATGQILLPAADSSRCSELSVIRLNVEWELRRLRKIIDTFKRSGKEWNLEEVIQKYNPYINKESSVFNFIQTQILRKKQLGKIRSSETYQTTLNSFMNFRQGVDLTFDMFDSELMELYEAELHNRGVVRNTSSFYLRILRTNYKLAVEKGLTQDCHPFKRVYCGMDKTVKRCLSFEEIKKDERAGLVIEAGFGFCPRHVHFQFLHARHVVCRHGLPQEK